MGLLERSSIYCVPYFSLLKIEKGLEENLRNERGFSVMETVSVVLLGLGRIKEQCVQRLFGCNPFGADGEGMVQGSFELVVDEKKVMVEVYHRVRESDVTFVR